MRLLLTTLTLVALAGCSVYEPPAGSRKGEPDANPGPAGPGVGGAGGGSAEVATTTGIGSSMGGAGTAVGSGGGAAGAIAGGAGGADAGSAGAGVDAGDAGPFVSEGGSAADVDVERAPQDVATVAVALPFVVDAYFVPTGYMGDGLRAGAITVETSGCKLPRPVGARGNCYRITYRPQPPAMAGNPAWGGVYWLSPQDNWGQKPGRKVQPGATAVTFYAAGATGTESVAFRTGGVQDPLLPNNDTFRVEQSFTLTTSLTKYSLDLTGQSYDTVIGGFAWIVVTYDAASWAPGAAPIVFYLDDIEWPK